MLWVLSLIRGSVTFSPKYQQQKKKKPHGNWIAAENRVTKLVYAFIISHVIYFKQTPT